MRAATLARARRGAFFGVLVGTLTLAGCAGEPDQSSSEPAAGQSGSADSAATDPTDASAEGAGNAPDDSSASADDSAPEDAEGSQEGAAPEDQHSGEQEPAELPGGGDTLFPDRRFVAAYGSPGGPALGILGAGGPQDAVERVTGYADRYQQHSEEPVQPALEIITTVATEAPGPDGDYTNALDPEVIEPWVELAAEEDVYVVLDLQPGHATFLSQAQIYEDFLAQPHVGLALDPEWRLAPGQRHMNQIGSVSAEEVNEVADWLAELTAAHELPQKMLMLHQFKHTMLPDREQIDTDHEELAFVLHADGHGSPDLKLGTYETLQEGLSEDVWLGWKNFYDEDSPMFSVEETYDVDPKPWFVSYQ